MGLLHHPVEKRLSAALGAPVTFDKLDVSLLGGSVDATGVTIGGDDPAVPFLTIRRVRAEIALGAAFRKEFVIKSLTLEKPIVTIVRGSDGQLNLPQRFRPNLPVVADASASAGQTSDGVSDTNATPTAEGTWKFEARKVLLVDGEVHFRDASGINVSFEQVLGEIKEAGTGLELTLIVDSATRRDEPAGPVQIRVQGRADNVPDLSHWQRAAVHATVEVGEALRAVVRATSLQPPQLQVDLTGSADMDSLAAFAPPGVKALDPIRSGALRGRAEVTARATYGPADGLRVPEFVLRATDLTLPTAANVSRDRSP